MAHDRTEVASGAPPLVTVEVIRKGGALLAIETFGVTLASVTVLFAGNWLGGIGRGSGELFTLVTVNLFVLVAGTFALWRRRDHRVELSVLGINVVAGAWRSRSLAWPEVAELEQRRILGSDELIIPGARGALLLSSGWGPWRDPDYERKAQRIRDYWTAYRWSSFPPPDDRPPPPSSPS